MVCREDGPARIRGSLQLHCRVEPSCLHVKWGADFGWLSRVDPSGMLVGLEMDPELNPCEGDVWGGKSWRGHEFGTNPTNQTTGSSSSNRGGWRRRWILFYTHVLIMMGFFFSFFWLQLSIVFTCPTNIFEKCDWRERYTHNARSHGIFRENPMMIS